MVSKNCMANKIRISRHTCHNRMNTNNVKTLSGKLEYLIKMTKSSTTTWNLIIPKCKYLL